MRFRDGTEDERGGKKNIIQAREEENANITVQFETINKEASEKYKRFVDANTQYSLNIIRRFFEIR